MAKKNHLTSAACRTWVNCHLFRAAQQKSRQFTQAETAGVMLTNPKGTVMYEPPKSDLSIEAFYGHCPSCNKEISYWVIVKPSLVPNRFKCNACGECLKFNYSFWIFLLFQVMGFFTGALIMLISIILSIVFFDENDYLVLAFAIAAVLFLPLIIIFAYPIALFSRKRYEILIAN